MLVKLIAISLLMMSSVATAYDILVLAPFPYHANWVYMENFIEGLLKRGHSLTTISPFLYKNKAEVENLNQIIIARYPIEKECEDEDERLFSSREEDLIFFPFFLQTPQKTSSPGDSIATLNTFRHNTKSDYICQSTLSTTLPFGASQKRRRTSSIWFWLTTHIRRHSLCLRINSTVL
jgi:hypothetical protein